MCSLPNLAVWDQVDSASAVAAAFGRRSGCGLPPGPERSRRPFC